ncbi:MAG: PhoH family protein [Candidatus Latescibacteria bacterium]|nr:PhoH family protein [Candidatus Latescibacterota bacterium]HJP28962.1 PhoH family protein [Candidatus Latescibacterota bacterium]
MTLFGHNDRNLESLEKSCGVSLVARGDRLMVDGPEESIRMASDLLSTVIESLRRDPDLSHEDVQALLRQDLRAASRPGNAAEGEGVGSRTVRTYKTTVRARSGGQLAYLESVSRNDIVFVIGPAGTGKTYLAVAAAVSALKQKKVSRIVLARPAVEAGENLGFLPGALEDKVDPYLRPLYDALQELLEPDRLVRFQGMKIVEVAPLAFMRGRTLNDAFIILDEAQNTTPAQMKMFLTRLGAGSKAVVTGDITQTDLPPHQPSGLIDVRSVLRDVSGLDFIHLTERDVVRNPLVQRIVQAYEGHDDATKADSST